MALLGRGHQEWDRAAGATRSNCRDTTPNYPKTPYADGDPHRLFAMNGSPLIDRRIDPIVHGKPKARAPIRTCSPGAAASTSRASRSPRASRSRAWARWPSPATPCGAARRRDSGCSLRLLVESRTRRSARGGPDDRGPSRAERLFVWPARIPFGGASGAGRRRRSRHRSRRGVPPAARIRPAPPRGPRVVPAVGGRRSRRGWRRPRRRRLPGGRRPGRSW